VSSVSLLHAQLTSPRLRLVIVAHEFQVSPNSALRAAVNPHAVDRRLQVRSHPPYPRFSTLSC
jgi:hypothetical protein